MQRPIIFIGIVVIAAALRFTGINWDQNAHLHPDERFLTMVATDIHWPQSIVEYFDTKISSANPHNVDHGFYVYGTYPVHLVKLVAQAVKKDTYEGITIVGRTMSGVVDLATLVFVFLIGGNLAAFLYAIMVLPIQQSHFFTVDPYATLFLTISLYLLIKNRIGWLLGISVGLAISAKISSILIVPVVILALIKGLTLPMQGETWKKFAKFVLAFLLTLRIFYPYLFDGWGLNQLVLDNWKELKAFDNPNTSFPPALQWIGVPMWKPATDLILYGLGLPLGILAIASITYYVSRIRNQKVNSIGILLFWILLVLGYQSFQFAKAMRYFYPIYPALAVFMGYMLSRLRISLVLALPAVFALLIWPLAFVSIYMRPHTRIAASDWMYQHVPKGLTLAWEHWDDPIPLTRGTNYMGQYPTIQLPMYDQDTTDKWQNVSKNIATADYILLSSNRVYGSIAHVADRYPQTNRYYTLLFSGRLGFEKVAELTSRPTLFGIEIVDDNAEESFTVYDHPKVTIFQNTARLSPDELFSRLYE